MSRSDGTQKKTEYAVFGRVVPRRPTTAVHLPDLKTFLPIMLSKLAHRLFLVDVYVKYLIALAFKERRILLRPPHCVALCSIWAPVPEVPNMSCAQMELVNAWHQIGLPSQTPGPIAADFEEQELENRSNDCPVKLNEKKRTLSSEARLLTANNAAMI